MNRGQYDLKQWIERRGLSQREAASVIGVHWTSINKLLHGRRLPSLELATRIETETGITTRSWVTTKGGKRASRVPPEQSNTL